jgi:hypothetical protein
MPSNASFSICDNWQTKPRILLHFFSIAKKLLKHKSFFLLVECSANKQRSLRRNPTMPFLQHQSLGGPKWEQSAYKKTFGLKENNWPRLPWYNSPFSLVAFLYKTGRKKKQKNTFLSACTQCLYPTLQLYWPEVIVWGRSTTTWGLSLTRVSWCLVNIWKLKLRLSLSYWKAINKSMFFYAWLGSSFQLCFNRLVFIFVI